MDGFKPLSEVLESNAYSKMLVTVNTETGEKFPARIDEFHNAIQKFELNGNPPDDVRKHFDLARNLFLYTWFVYGFSTPAIGQAHASVEMALREKFKTLGMEVPRHPNLTKLLRAAIENGWIKDGGFPHLFTDEEPEFPFKKVERNPDGTDYCQLLLETMPGLRNSLAHGKNMVMTPGMALMPLNVCGRIIDQLFP